MNNTYEVVYRDDKPIGEVSVTGESLHIFTSYDDEDFFGYTPLEARQLAHMVLRAADLLEEGQ